MNTPLQRRLTVLANDELALAHRIMSVPREYVHLVYRTVAALHPRLRDDFITNVAVCIGLSPSEPELRRAIEGALQAVTP